MAYFEIRILVEEVNFHLCGLCPNLGNDGIKKHKIFLILRIFYQLTLLK